MAQTKCIDTEALAEEARASQNKEACRVLEKTGAYRISVGVRITFPSPSFFVEIIIAFPSENGEVDLPRLEKLLTCLKTLKARGYSLVHDEGCCIFCETAKPSGNLCEECAAIEVLMESCI